MVELNWKPSESWPGTLPLDHQRRWEILRFWQVFEVFKIIKHFFLQNLLMDYNPAYNNSRQHIKTAKYVYNDDICLLFYLLSFQCLSPTPCNIYAIKLSSSARHTELLYFLCTLHTDLKSIGAVLSSDLICLQVFIFTNFIFCLAGFWVYFAF